MPAAAATKTFRGLRNFINDIRECKTPDAEAERVSEELAKIRNKFSTKLGAYDMKKYMWKILYIKTLGYPVEFGHIQATEFLHHDSFAIKQVGYLSVSLLLIEHTDMLRLCLNSMKQDLESGNEYYVCLALACIANVALPEFAPNLVNEVTRLLIDPKSPVNVTKKASLTLLRLIRQNPDCIPTIDDRAITGICNLTEHRNDGVLTTVMSLLIGLAKEDPAPYQQAVPKIIDILERYVLKNSAPRSYIYYRTPCPWLQVKCLRFLQFHPPPAQKQKLERILKTILESTEVTTSVNKNNADHSILFEAINVIIHMNINGAEMLNGESMTYLLKFIAVKEPNIRYLGLEAMTRLAKIRDTQKSIQENLKTIQYSLDDDDISVRRRALDLLYGIANEDNAEEIVDILLDCLKTCEHVMKSEVVLKIAIIVEKHSSSLEWYVDTSLQLLEVAGDFVTEDVGHRIIQVVTNNESLQLYAVNKCYKLLQERVIFEPVLRVAGYLVGEFGYQSDIDGADQFAAIHKHFHESSKNTQCMLLTTYMKFGNMFPNLIPEVTKIFESFEQSEDPELQQRAVEYKMMANFKDQDLINNVWGTMPEFPEREGGFHEKIKNADARHAVSVVKQNDSEHAPRRDEDDDSSSGSESEDEEEEVQAKREPPKKVDDLLDFGAMMQPAAPVSNPPAQQEGSTPFGDIFSQPAKAPAAVKPVSLRDVMTKGRGVIFSNGEVTFEMLVQKQLEEGVIKVIVKEIQGASGTVAVTGISRSESECPVQFHPTTQQSLQDCKIYFRAQCNKPFSTFPVVSLNVNGRAVSFDLPLDASSFCMPEAVDAAGFTSAAQQCSQETKKTFAVPQSINAASLASMIPGLGLANVPFPERPGEIYGYGVLHTGFRHGSNLLRMPVMLRTEYAASHSQVRCTLRSSSASLNDSFMSCIQRAFNS